MLSPVRFFPLSWQREDKSKAASRPSLAAARGRQRHDPVAAEARFPIAVTLRALEPDALFVGGLRPRPARGLGGHEAAGPAALLVRAGDPITAQHERILSNGCSSRRCFRAAGDFHPPLG